MLYGISSSRSLMPDDAPRLRTLQWRAARRHPSMPKTQIGLSEPPCEALPWRMNYRQRQSGAKHRPRAAEDNVTYPFADAIMPKAWHKAYASLRSIATQNLQQPYVCRQPIAPLLMSSGPFI